MSEWPGVALDDALFRAYAEARGCDVTSPHAADVFLACACAHGAQGALSAFDASFGDIIARGVARVNRSPAFVADASQAVRMKLFVGPSPKINEYSGRSKLSAWLGVVAMRLAQSTMRKKGEQSHAALADLVEQVAPSGGGAELSYIKRRYKSEFEAAVRDAMAQLSPRDSALLRQHFGEGLGVDALGEVYKVGRSTAARWLAGARDALREGTARRLKELFDLTPSEYGSLAGVVQSQLEISLGGLVRGEAAPPPHESGDGAATRCRSGS